MRLIRRLRNAHAFYKTLRSLEGNLNRQYPAIESHEQLAQKFGKSTEGHTTSLDLGCGSNPRNPFQARELFGIDQRSDLSKDIRQANLATDAIPFDSNFFDYCTAFDVLEHIPRISWNSGESRMAFIELMNEIHRILKPNGLFLHSTPAYPAKEAFQDPTHVNIITEDTLPSYFCEPNNWAKQLGYGFNGRFELLQQGWVCGIWVVGVLRALK